MTYCSASCSERAANSQFKAEGSSLVGREADDGRQVQLPGGPPTSAFSRFSSLAAPLLRCRYSARFGAISPN
jgi:hypothetical protein